MRFHIAPLIAFLMTTTATFAADSKNSGQNNTTVEATTVVFESQLHGRCVLTYCDTGVKLESLDRGVQFLSSAPAWRMYYSKPAHAVYCESDCKDFMPDDIKTFHSMRPGAPSFMKPLDYRRGELFNLPCQICRLDSPQKFDGKLHRWQAMSCRDGQMWVDTKTRLPEFVVHTIQRSLGLPYSKGMPWQLITHTFAGGKKKELEPSRVEKTRVKTAFFTLPAGYKKLASPSAVGNNQDPEVYDLMR